MLLLLLLVLRELLLDGVLLLAGMRLLLLRRLLGGLLKELLRRPILKGLVVEVEVLLLHAAPRRRVEEDVGPALVGGGLFGGFRSGIFGEPVAELLVPPPVALIAARESERGKGVSGRDSTERVEERPLLGGVAGEEEERSDSQLLSGDVLQHVPGRRVEDEEEGLLGEEVHLALSVGGSDVVARRSGELLLEMHPSGVSGLGPGSDET